jgi:transposase-like protein
MSQERVDTLYKNGANRVNGSNGVERSDSAVPVEVPDPEVVPRAKRRVFSTTYKLRILAQADRCTKPGEIGALLRSEGLYSSHLTTWRRQRENGELGKRRGRPSDPSAKEITRLKAENVRLAARLEKAEAIIEVQKKLCILFGLNSETTSTGDEK